MEGVFAGSYREPEEKMICKLLNGQSNSASKHTNILELLKY